ncbi:MAG: cell wall-binding protein, partial [Oscillospiraceae bacterium]|nr:cell wall-binding protein [Oscillospiraceae bacterium]
VAADAPVLDGWVFLDGVRCFYQNGAPRVGWYCDGGADYYFKEDGSVTTGWAEINGRWRYFSDTGVMRTGWIDTEQGKCYMLSNGVAALGEKEIDGVVYDFGENGILIG